MTCGRTYRASRGEYPYDRGKYLTMVLELRAYSDESGDITHPSCTIAGFIASPKQWRIFNNEWAAVLDGEGVSAFHSMDFFSPVSWRSSTSLYHGWSEARADTYIENLLKVFSAQYKHLHRANGAVDVNDFMQMSEDWRRIFTGAMIKWQVRDGQFTSRISGTGKPSAPWFVCFIDFVQHMLTHAPDGAIVNLLCDEQAEYAPLAQITWNNMKKHKAMGWKKMGDIGFGSDTIHPPLQLADMYANLLNYAIPRYGKGLTDARRAGALGALLKDGKRLYMHKLESLERRAREISDAIIGEIELHYEGDE